MNTNKKIPFEKITKSYENIQDRFLRTFKPTLLEVFAIEQSTSNTKLEKILNCDDFFTLTGFLLRVIPIFAFFIAAFAYLGSSASYIAAMFLIGLAISIRSDKKKFISIINESREDIKDIIVTSNYLDDMGDCPAHVNIIGDFLDGKDIVNKKELRTVCFSLACISAGCAELKKISKSKAYIEKYRN